VLNPNGMIDPRLGLNHLLKKENPPDISGGFGLIN
jgi:hypothetical protein